MSWIRWIHAKCIIIITKACLRGNHVASLSLPRFQKEAHALGFFPPQEVFPVQYGTKFDTALQTLIAGLVCKLEQLLPVPNLSQVPNRDYGVDRESPKRIKRVRSHCNVI